MLAARLGDGAANRAFAERWWRGAVRGTDVLFPAGESMAAALRRLQAESAAVDWQAAVARFRSALAKTEKLASERSEVAAAVTRISDLEQACEEASCSAEAAQARLADLAAGEPAVREALAAAEEEQQALLADLGAHQLNRPVFSTVTEDGKTALRSRSALSIALAGGVRRGRNWRAWTARRRELRAACAEAELRREAAAKELQTLSASLAVAWTAVNDETAEVSRLTAEIGPLAEAVALARQRWGDHVPDGPAQAETEDAALIEWRETSAPWADEEYAASRAEVFLAALDLHKTLIAARADVFSANLGALMDLLCADPGPGPAPAPTKAAPGRSPESAADADAAARGRSRCGSGRRGRGGRGRSRGRPFGGGHSGGVAVALPGCAGGSHAVRCDRAALRRPRADVARLAAGRSRRAAARLAGGRDPGPAEPRSLRGRHGRLGGNGAQRWARRPER